ncbi:MAG: hypothetical protein AAGD10_10345 [Myxococcota bacterium]
MDRRGAGLGILGLLTACGVGSGPGRPDPTVASAPPAGPAPTTPTPFTIEWPLDGSDLLGAASVRFRGRREAETSIIIDGELAQGIEEQWWLDVPLQLGPDQTIRVTGLKNERFTHRDLRLHVTQPIGPIRRAVAAGAELIALQDGHLLVVDPVLNTARRVVPERAITGHPLDEPIVDLAASTERLFVLTAGSLYMDAGGPEALRRLFRFPIDSPGRRVRASPDGRRLGLVLGPGKAFEHSLESGEVILHLPPEGSVMALSDGGTWFVDGTQLLRGALQGGAPSPVMALSLTQPPQRLMVGDSGRLALVDGGELLTIEPEARRLTRVELDFVPEAAEVLIGERLWASVRVGAGPDQLMAFDVHTGSVVARVGDSPSANLGLFEAFAEDLRPRPGLGLVVRQDNLLFPRASRSSMFSWHLDDASFDSASLETEGPHLAFLDDEELVLGGQARSWLWRPDGASLARPGFGEGCPLSRATAVKDHWVGLCDVSTVLVRARGALGFEAIKLERPLKGLSAGSGTRVWLADDELIFEWDVERYITLRLRRLPSGTPPATALLEEDEILYVAAGGGVLRFDADGRAGVIAPPPPFASQLVELHAVPSRSLLMLVDAAQRGVFALDLRTGQRALVLR